MNSEQQGAAVAAAAAAAAPTTARWRLAAALAFVLMLAVLLVALGCQRRQEPVFEVLAAPAAEEAKVYVTGEVAQPGVYPIAPGERVVDVVARAGGLNPEADTLRINLAIRLQDEMHVHISTRPSTPEGQQAPSSALRPTSVPRSRAAAGGPPSAAAAGGRATGQYQHGDNRRAGSLAGHRHRLRAQDCGAPHAAWSLSGAR